MANIPTTKEILEAFTGTYQEVETSAISGVFQDGLDKLNEQFKQLNISGTDKAKLIAQYVIATTATIVTSSQQAAVQMIVNAYNIPAQVENQNAQTAYQNKQSEILEKSLIQNTLIKAFQEIENMMGTLGSGNLVAPAPLIYTALASVYMAIKELDIADTDMSKILQVVKPIMIGDPKPGGGTYTRDDILKDADMRDANNTSYNITKV